MSMIACMCMGFTRQLLGVRVIDVRQRDVLEGGSLDIERSIRIQFDGNPILGGRESS